MPFDARSLGRALSTAARVIRAVSGRIPEASARRTPRPETLRGSFPETGLSAPYRGDYRGRLNIAYSPDPDGRPDPGEIVWTWVPYEEDHSRGKDRPVLLVGHAGDRLLGLMLTSKDRNGAGADGPRRDDDYVDIGSGSWDPRGRPSEVRLDRIIQIDPRDLRREGAVLDKNRFGAVARALQERRNGK